MFGLLESYCLHAVDFDGQLLRSKWGHKKGMGNKYWTKVLLS